MLQFIDGFAYLCPKPLQQSGCLGHHPSSPRGSSTYRLFGHSLLEASPEGFLGGQPGIGGFGGRVLDQVLLAAWPTTLRAKAVNPVDLHRGIWRVMHTNVHQWLVHLDWREEMS